MAMEAAAGGGLSGGWERLLLALDWETMEVLGGFRGSSFRDVGLVVRQK